MPDNRAAQTSEILGHMTDDLDVPQPLHDAAEREYNHLGEWLNWDNLGRRLGKSDVYPQGSLRLGTVVKPVTPNGEFDFDIVYVRNLQKQSVTQEELKTSAKEQLGRYVKCRNERDGSNIELVEKGRCITLNYPNQFHMDVLPAIPDPDGHSNSKICCGESLLISDREIRLWLPTNPKAYANWFTERTKIGATKMAAFAAREGVEVEPIRPPHVPTPLQRSVQLLKRHRDAWYATQRKGGLAEENRPISIIITTLAALVYEPAGTLLETVQRILGNMQSGIEEREGVLWVANPVVPAENFAEKWQDNPERAKAFRDWLNTASEDIEKTAGADLKGFPAVAGLMFGGASVSKALNEYATSMAKQRTNGRLAISSELAGLTSGGGIIIPEHRFYGDVETTH